MANEDEWVYEVTLWSVDEDGNDTQEDDIDHATHVAFKSNVCDDVHMTVEQWKVLSEYFMERFT